MDDELIPLIPITYVQRVREIIAQLERRAAAGERFAQLALQGWKRELERLEQGEIY